MTYKFGAVALVALAVSVASCRKDPAPTPDTNTGGKGGNATLRISPKHHAKYIDSCMVYIKYNTQDKPTGSYDDSARCVMVDNVPVATLSGLKKGQYYLYGKGWDKEIQEAVDGGAPYTISEETTLNYNLAVTEDH